MIWCLESVAVSGHALINAVRLRIPIIITALITTFIILLALRNIKR